MAKLLFHKFQRGIEFDERQFSKENLERFDRAIQNKGAILKNVVGFIDGTMQQVCRPDKRDDQKVAYNGWKHMHYLKYQAITTPDGIISSLFGPFAGSQNGKGIFKTSGTLERLYSHFSRVSPDVDYCVYGDEGYSINYHIRVPFSSINRTEAQQYCNETMSKVRALVEMESSKLAQKFSASKWKYGNRIIQTRPALEYILSTILKTSTLY